MTDTQFTTHTDLFDLHGKSALVTGGTRGIGMMIARGLLQAGARVVISSRGADSCAQAQQLLSEFGDVQLPSRGAFPLAAFRDAHNSTIAALYGIAALVSGLEQGLALLALESRPRSLTMTSTEIGRLLPNNGGLQANSKEH